MSCLRKQVGRIKTISADELFVVSSMTGCNGIEVAKIRPFKEKNSEVEV